MNTSDGAAPETLERRIKRLRIRCWRRGTKEMDLILGGFVDREASRFSESDVDQLEAIVHENDHDLYRWIAGSEAPPTQHLAMIERLKDR